MSGRARDNEREDDCGDIHQPTCAAEALSCGEFYLGAWKSAALGPSLLHSAEVVGLTILLVSSRRLLAHMCRSVSEVRSSHSKA